MPSLRGRDHLPRPSTTSISSCARATPVCCASSSAWTSPAPGPAPDFRWRASARAAIARSISRCSPASDVVYIRGTNVTDPWTLQSLPDRATTPRATASSACASRSRGEAGSRGAGAAPIRLDGGRHGPHHPESARPPSRGEPTAATNLRARPTRARAPAAGFVAGGMVIDALPMDPVPQIALTPPGVGSRGVRGWRELLLPGRGCRPRCRDVRTIFSQTDAAVPAGAVPASRQSTQQLAWWCASLLAADTGRGRRAAQPAAPSLVADGGSRPGVLRDWKPTQQSLGRLRPQPWLRSAVRRGGSSRTAGSRVVGCTAPIVIASPSSWAKSPARIGPYAIESRTRGRRDGPDLRRRAQHAGRRAAPSSASSGCPPRVREEGTNARKLFCAKRTSRLGCAARTSSRSSTSVRTPARPTSRWSSSREPTSAQSSSACPDKRLPPDLIAFVLVEMAHGLHEAHGGGGAHAAVVHRNLSPSNVLVSTMGEVEGIRGLWDRESALGRQGHRDDDARQVRVHFKASS